MNSLSVEQIYFQYSSNYESHRDLIRQKALYDSNLKEAEGELKQYEKPTAACDLVEIIRSFLGNNTDHSIVYNHVKYKVDSFRLLSTQTQEKIDTVFSNMLQFQQIVQNPDQAHRLIMDVCGGEQRYQALKEIPVDKQVRVQGWITVRVEDMIDPIMKFKDAYNRSGIAICAKSQGRLTVQTFYQRADANWTSYGTIISADGYLIDQGVLNVQAFEKLKLLITNKLENWELAYSKKV